MKRIAVLLIAVAVGCAGGNKPAPTPTPPSRLSSSATVNIIEPVQGATVRGPTVHVKVELTGARIVPQTTKDVKQDEGHIHILLDGTVISMTSGLESDITAQSGMRLLEVEFVAADHIPFNPRVLAKATFTVA